MAVIAEDPTQDPNAPAKKPVAPAMTPTAPTPTPLPVAPAPTAPAAPQAAPAIQAPPAANTSPAPATPPATAAPALPVASAPAANPYAAYSNPAGEVTDQAGYLKAINTVGSPESKAFAPPGYSQMADGTWLANNSNSAFKFDNAANDYVRMPGVADASTFGGLSNAPGVGTGATPSTPGSGIPLAGPPAPVSGGADTLPVAGGDGYANLVDSRSPGADYLGQTIQPGPGVDRLALAESNFNNFAEASDPYYQKTLRDANSSAAGAGRLGSGMLRTSLGDAANLRNLQLDTAKQGYLNDATNGSIEDQYRNIGIAQQQQGFQAGREDTANNLQMAQQGQAFDQSAREIALNEALTQGDFGRYQALLASGEQGNPSDTALTLAHDYNSQAGQAGQGAANLIGNAINANSQRYLVNGQQTSSPNGGSQSGGVNLASLFPDGVPDWMRPILNAGSGGVQQTGGTPQLPIDTGYSGGVYQPPKPAGL